MNLSKGSCDYIKRGYHKDYNQTFTKVIKISTLKILWALIVTQDWEIEQMDTILVFT